MGVFTWFGVTALIVICIAAAYFIYRRGCTLNQWKHLTRQRSRTKVLVVTSPTSAAPVDNYGMQTMQSSNPTPTATNVVASPATPSRPTSPTRTVGPPVPIRPAPTYLNRAPQISTIHLREPPPSYAESSNGEFIEIGLGDEGYSNSSYIGEMKQGTGKGGPGGEGKRIRPPLPPKRPGGAGREAFEEMGSVFK